MPLTRSKARAQAAALAALAAAEPPAEPPVAVPEPAPALIPDDALVPDDEASSVPAPVPDDIGADDGSDGVVVPPEAVAETETDGETEPEPEDDDDDDDDDDDSSKPSFSSPGSSKGHVSEDSPTSSGNESSFASSSDDDLRETNARMNNADNLYDHPADAAPAIASLRRGVDESNARHDANDRAAIGVVPAVSADGSPPPAQNINFAGAWVEEEEEAIPVASALPNRSAVDTTPSASNPAVPVPPRLERGIANDSASRHSAAGTDAAIGHPEDESYERCGPNLVFVFVNVFIAILIASAFC